MNAFKNRLFSVLEFGYVALCRVKIEENGAVINFKREFISVKEKIRENCHVWGESPCVEDALCRNHGAWKWLCVGIAVWGHCILWEVAG